MKTASQLCGKDVQVLEWTQTMLRVGEAFSGEPCTSLRDAVQRQSGRFFQVSVSSSIHIRSQQGKQGPHVDWRISVAIYVVLWQASATALSSNTLLNTSLMCVQLQAFHSSNMVSLHSILGNELWNALPAGAARCANPPGFDGMPEHGHPQSSSLQRVDLDIGANPARCEHPGPQPALNVEPLVPTAFRT